MRTSLPLRSRAGRDAALAALRVLFVSAALSLGACVEDATGPDAGGDAERKFTGQMAIRLDGLPPGAAAGLTVLGPAGYRQRISSSDTLRGLAPGQYALDIDPVAANGQAWFPEQSSQVVEVADGALPHLVGIRFATMPRTALIIVDVSNLPSGAAASARLTGPGNASHTIVRTDTLRNVALGDWTLSANPVSVGGSILIASPVSQTKAVRSRDAVIFRMRYSTNTGSLALAVVGLPAGANGRIRLAGPDSFQRELTGTETVTGLPPGAYSITADSVIAGGITFAPTPTASTVNVTTSEVAAGVTVAYSAVSAPPGTMNLTVSGLPAGSPAQVMVTGPNGYSRSVTGTTSLTGLTAGAYTVSATAVRTSMGSYDGPSAAQTVNVTASQSVSTTVTYSARPAVVIVSANGVPGGSSPALTLTNPAGVATTLTAGTELPGATPGRWRLSAAPISAGGFSYAPSPASFDATVLAGDTLRFPVTYALSSGAVAITIGGLPDGASGSVVVTGPNGFSRAIAATQTLIDLVPGTYTVTASPVTVGGLTFAPSPATRTVTVSASLVAQAAAVAYASQSGALALSLSGLPAGAAADVQLTGPGSTSQTITSGGPIENLAPGTYSLAVRPVRTALGTYASTPATRTFVISTGATTTQAVTYAPLPAAVAITVSGLPGGAAPALSLTTPAGTVSSPTASTVIAPAAAGRWRLSSGTVQSGGHSYTPTLATYDQSVLAGDTLAFPVQYALSTGAMAVSVAGLPHGALGAITVTGPNGFTRAITGTTTLVGLAPGSYAVAAAGVTSAGVSYLPSPATRTVTITTSLVAQPAAVTYAAQVGRLIISATGLAGGAVPTFSLTGPVSRTISSAVTVDSLPPGSYTLTAATVTAGGVTYTPSAASRSVSVTAGATTNASFSYTGSGGGSTTPNLRVENAYITQAVQTWSGAATLVAGRQALVRVFVTAASSNSLQPTVRVRLFENGALFRTLTIPAPGTSVPTSVNEGVLTSSWNAVIPGSDVRPGLQLLVDVDPNNVLSESDRSDNLWPATGTPRAVPTNTVTPLTVRFVPVTVAGITGDVSGANVEAFSSMMREVWPVSTVNISVRAPFTSSAQALQSSDANRAWGTVLSEMGVLRTTDAAPSTTHYYGVVKTSYGSGVAGVATTPGRTAVGWDNSGTAARIAAHEIGHNFGLGHSPCGVSGSSSYPFAGGVTGAWGWNSATNTLLAPTATDVMGYCSTQWISEWSWTRAMSNRSFFGFVADASIGDALIVWGREVNGALMLEPSFRTQARLSRPVGAGSHRVVVRGASGSELVSTALELEAVEHTDGTRVFAVAIPWNDAWEREISAVEVFDARNPTAARAVERAQTTSMLQAGDPLQADSLATVRLEARPRGRALVRWDDRRHKLAVVRDANTGEIMALLRKDGTDIRQDGRPLEVMLSDGLHTQRRAIR